MHLTFDKLLRTETDETIINTLKRKGWQEIDPPLFNPETEYYMWNDGEWIVLQIPKPQSADMSL